MSVSLGYTAAVVIPAAWLFFRYEVYETGHWTAVNPAVVWLAAAGNAMMTYYALLIQDTPFFLLHLTVTCFAATEFALLVYMRKTHRVENGREES